MNSPWLWLLVPIAPLLAGALTVLGKRSLWPWLWLTCLPALAFSILPPAPLHLDVLWPGAALGADDIVARGWLGFTALLWACASLFAAGDLKGDPNPGRFGCFWFLSLTGNLLLCIGQDVLTFYVGFTVMSMAAYGLVVHRGGPEPRRAGRIYLQLAVTGEMVLLGAIAMRSFAAGGALEFTAWEQEPVEGLTLGLLVLGFGLKVGFWPLHVWLPLAHPAAPSPASAVLSGAMIEAGILGLWRCLPADDPVLQQWAEPLLMLGVFTAFYGVAVGLLATRAKAALAYSSISQMGYLLAILALAWRHPEHQQGLALLLVLFAAHHGLAKGALFLGSGIHPLGRYGICMLAIPALAISGLPLTSGGAVKGELKHWLGESDFSQWSPLFKAATAGTTLLLARALFLLWQADRDRDESEKRNATSMLLPFTILCAASLVMSLLWPAFLEMLLKNLKPATLWELLWPMGLALLVSFVVLRQKWRLPTALRERRNHALHASAGLKRLLQNPPLPHNRWQADSHYWRWRERKWNHFWNRRGIVASSMWLLSLLVLLGVIWSFLL